MYLPYAKFHHENSIQGLRPNAKNEPTLVNSSWLQTDTKLRQSTLKQALIDDNWCLVPNETLCNFITPDTKNEPKYFFPVAN